MVLFGFWEGFWDMPTCFQMFVEVFEAIRWAENEIKQKTSFFSPIPLLKSSISKNEKCRAKTLTFLWFQCIFLTNWVSKMGKPLVPVAPTHLGHLGHPTVLAHCCCFLVEYLAVAGWMNFLTQLSDRIHHFTVSNLMPLAFLTKLSNMH